MQRLIILFSILSFSSIPSLAQKADTIVTMRGNIVGHVTEVTPDLIGYTNPNETIIYKIEKGAVAKICFGNGRVEKYADLKSLSNLQGTFEWPKVNVATTEYETKGLYKIDYVSAKATGTTVYSSVSRVQDRAIDKLKMASALLGGNLVYIKNESLEGNIRSEQGGRTSRAQILGTVYCSQLADSINFKEILKAGNHYTLVSKLGLRNNDSNINTLKAINEPVEINSTQIEKGFIYLDLTISQKKSKIRYRVISYSAQRILVAYKEGTAYYNILLAKE